SQVVSAPFLLQASEASGGSLECVVGYQHHCNACEAFRSLQNVDLPDTLSAWANYAWCALPQTATDIGIFQSATSHMGTVSLLPESDKGSSYPHDDRVCSILWTTVSSTPSVR